MEFYALMQTLKHWRPYLIRREFILYTDHDSLKHLNSQTKMNARHARWMDYVQQFDFLIKHKAGAENKVADALSRRPHLLHITSVMVTEFDSMKNEYSDDEDFSRLWNELSSQNTQHQGDYMLRDGFLFFKSHLCTDF